VRRAETLAQIPEGEPPMHEMALGLTYLRAIEATGGLPVVIPPLRIELIEPLLDEVAGICLSGGPDLHPRAYGQEPDEHLGPTEPDLDRFELAVARRADNRAMPILAICRGAQALNVVRGGTLIQHLPDVTDGSIEHRQTAPARTSTHDVRIERRSAMGEVLRAGVAAVNTFHHQAVDRLGAGLRVVGHAPDGVVEAIEATDGAYLRGVQWHAETLVDRPTHLALFADLVRRAAVA